jgi:hypothetical protein
VTPFRAARAACGPVGVGLRGVWDALLKIPVRPCRLVAITLTLDHPRPGMSGAKGAAWLNLRKNKEAGSVLRLKGA